MQRTLSEHIAYLEKKVESLKKEMAEPAHPEVEKSNLLVDLGMAERALVHFRKAFELEQRISQRSRP